MFPLVSVWNKRSHFVLSKNASSILPDMNNVLAAQYCLLLISNCCMSWSADPIPMKAQSWLPRHNNNVIWILSIHVCISIPCSDSPKLSNSDLFLDHPQPDLIRYVSFYQIFIMILTDKCMEGDRRTSSHCHRTSEPPWGEAQWELCEPQFWDRTS